VHELVHVRSEPRTGGGLNGFEPTFAVADVDAIAAAVEQPQPKRYGGRPRAPTSARNRCPDHGSAAERPGV